jgi:very-short-patch-repair endonuclease
MQQNDSYNNSLHKHATPKIYENAKTLRQTETGAEKLLWQELEST